MTYLILKFVHVVSVIVWVGGMIMLMLLNRAVIKSGDDTVARALGQQGGKLSMTVFGPAFLVALITGIGMVQTGDLSWGAFWINWGMAGAFLSMILGGMLTGRTAKRLGQEVAAGKATPEHIAATQKKIMLYATLNLLLLLSIVWMMVVKP
jgi:uncharacterized membrane protein